MKLLAQYTPPALGWTSVFLADQNYDEPSSRAMRFSASLHQKILARRAYWKSLRWRTRHCKINLGNREEPSLPRGLQDRSILLLTRPRFRLAIGHEEASGGRHDASIILSEGIDVEDHPVGPWRVGQH